MGKVEHDPGCTYDWRDESVDFLLNDASIERPCGNPIDGDGPYCARHNTVITEQASGA